MAKKTSRMGGRAARQALRAAPIPEEEKPVRPGLQSGRYQPLTQEEVERIHEAALQTLETIGFANALPSIIERVTAAGGTYTEDERLLIPRSLVDEALAASKAVWARGVVPRRHAITGPIAIIPTKMPMTGLKVASKNGGPTVMRAPVIISRPSG